MTIFSAIRQCINNAELNSTISRQELFDYAWKTYGYMETYASVDSIRRALTKLGYIELVERGRYKICKHIPEHLNTSDIYKLAYSKPTLKTCEQPQTYIAEQTKSKPTILSLVQNYVRLHKQNNNLYYIPSIVKYCHRMRQDACIRNVTVLLRKLVNAKYALFAKSMQIELLKPIEHLTVQELDSMRSIATHARKINRDTEYILCAAIKRKTPRTCKPYHEGTNDICNIEIGYRHHDIIMRFSGELNDCEQGFYTSCGRYVDRYEAMRIAYEAGQVSEQVALNKGWHDIELNMTDKDGNKIDNEQLKQQDPSRYNQLFSEDLYGGY